MPASITDDEMYLCVTFRVACPDNKFMYPFEIREGNTENPVYAWTMEANEAKVWCCLGDPQFVRVMAKYPAAETTYMARLIQPRMTERRTVATTSVLATERRKQHGIF